MSNNLFDIAMIHSMSLERFKKYDYNGSAKYYKPEVVDCYKEDKFQKILNANGEEVTSRGRYYTAEKVTALDRIDGYDILNYEHFDFGGGYYIAYV